MFKLTKTQILNIAGQSNQSIFKISVDVYKGETSPWGQDSAIYLCHIKWT